MIINSQQKVHDRQHYVHRMSSCPLLKTIWSESAR